MAYKPARTGQIGKCFMANQNGTRLTVGAVVPVTEALLTRTRVGGGGGGRRAEWLDAARALKPGEALPVVITGPAGETGDNVSKDMFDRRKNSMSASLRGTRGNGQPTLGFQVVVRGNFATRTVNVIRLPDAAPAAPAAS